MRLNFYQGYFSKQTRDQIYGHSIPVCCVCYIHVGCCNSRRFRPYFRHSKKINDVDAAGLRVSMLKDGGKFRKLYWFIIITIKHQVLHSLTANIAINDRENDLKTQTI